LQRGVKRIIFFSTIAVYGQSNAQILNEDSLPHPDTFYAKTKLAAEQIVLDAKTQEGEPIGTVLRFGAIYGSRIKSNYSRLLKSLAHGKFIPIGKGRNRRTLIYDRDVAQAAILAVQHPEAAGKIYNVSDGEFHTLNEIINTMCEALGRTPPRISLPIGPVRCTVGILEDAGRMIGYQSPIGRATINKFTEDIAVDSQLIQKELGFKPDFDLKKGWQETFGEMRCMGYL
jgi:UDP-glucose 4-epimerase